MEQIAEESLIAVRPSGERVPVAAGIGRPYAVGPEEWACPVTLAGLYQTLADVHAGSSLQALCLAASLIRNLLTFFVNDGGRLFYDDGQSEFDINATFSGIGDKN